jgi:hypothetical protein
MLRPWARTQAGAAVLLLALGLPGWCAPAPSHRGSLLDLSDREAILCPDEIGDENIVMLLGGMEPYVVITSPAEGAWLRVGEGDFACACVTSGPDASWSVEYGYGTSFPNGATGNAGVAFHAEQGGYYHLSASINGATDDVYVYVAELWGLYADGIPGEPWGEQVYVPQRNGVNASIYAEAMGYPDPPPSGIVSWTGGSAGGNQFERRVSAGTTGSTLVYAQVGTSSASVTVTVYTVSNVTVTGATPGQTNTYYTPIAAQDQYITVSASTTCGTPQGACGLINWSGDGEAVNDYMWRIPKWTGGTKSVRILAGDYDRTLTFHVVEIAGLTATGATSGTSGNVYYARKAANASATFSVEINPGISLASLPSNMVFWTLGGQAGTANAASVSLSRAATGSTGVTVTCGESSASKSLVVFEPGVLLVLDAEEGTPEGTYYAAVGSGYVTVTLPMDPAIASPGDFPSQLVTWSGGEPGINLFERRVSMAAGAEEIVSVSCEGFEDTVTIDVISVEWLEVYDAWPGSSAFYAFKHPGQNVTLTAFTYPYIEVANLPAGFVTWNCSGGTEGAGPLEWLVPRGASGTTTCTVTCGASSKSATVIVVEATALTVGGAAPGLPADSYYTGTGETGSKVALILSINPAIAPADLPWGLVWWQGNVELEWMNPLVCYVAKDVAGGTPVQVQCGGVTEQATIYVMEVGGLIVSGGTPGHAAGTYYVRRGPGNVTLTALFNPSVEAGNVPAGIIGWSGSGTAGATADTWTIPTATPGVESATVACGYSGCSATVIVVEAMGLTVTDAVEGNPEDTWYDAKGPGYVTVAVNLNPGVTASDVPEGIVSWDGDGEPVDALTRRVSKQTAGEYVLTASCGAWSETRVVRIMEIQWVNVSGAWMGMMSWTHYYAPVSPASVVTLTLSTYPEVADGDLPDGIIGWSGDVTGTGQFTRTMSCAADGDYSASVACGGDSWTVDLTMFAVTDLLVAGATAGTPDDTYYAKLGFANEYVAVTATLSVEVDEQDFPWDVLQWTGGGWSYGSPLVRTIPAWESASTTVGLTCGGFAGQRVIKVVAVTSLTVSGAVPGQTAGNYYCVLEEGDEVTLAAQINPTVAPQDLPEGFIEWTGGDAGADVLHRTVSRDTADVSEISVECGQSATQATVYVVQATEMTVSDAVAGNPQDTWYAAIGAGNVTLSVGTLPTLTASDLPNDFLSWTGGDAGATPLERVVSRGTAGETAVSVSLGEEPVGQATVRVIEVLWLLVSAADRGNNHWERCYAAQSATTATFAAVINPDVSASDLPDGIVTWSGGQVADRLTRTMSRAATGSFPIGVACGTSGESATLYVYAVTGPTVTGAEAGTTADSYYTPICNPQAYEYVEVEAQVTPALDPQDFPWGALQWTGGGYSLAPLTRGVPKWITGQMAVGLTCGTFSKTVTINVEDIAVITAGGAAVLNGGTVYVQKAATGGVVIDATLTPAAASGELPAGFVSWTGGAAVQGTQLQRTVTKTATGATTVTCQVGTTGTQWSVTVVVVGIGESASPNPDPNRRLWYFNGTSGGGNFALAMTLTAVGASAGSFEWTVTVGTDKAYFSGSGTATETRNNDNTVVIASCGASTAVDDVTVSLRIDGIQAATHAVTVYAPQYVVPTPSANINKTWPPNSTPDNPFDGNAGTGGGFTTWYYWTVTDMFNNPLPANADGNESINGWTNNVSNNWEMGTAGYGAITMGTDGVSTFRDNYRFTSDPVFNPSPSPACMPAWQGAPPAHPVGWDSNVKYTVQYYKIGTNTVGCGRIVKTQTAQFRQGSGRAQ